MNNILNRNIKEQIPIQTILEMIDQKRILDYMKYNLDLIDRTVFPDFQYHNITHLLNVGLLSMIIAEFYNLDEVNKKILLDSSFLHDVGRINDAYDYNHCYIGATLAEGILSNQLFYQAKQNISLVKTLILGHGENIYDISIFSKHKVQRSYENLLLLKILKDADILERVRLNNQNIDLDEINLDVSKSLFDFATYLNESKLTDKLIEVGDLNELSRNINQNWWKY